MFSSFLEASHSKALLHCLISYKWVSLASDMGYMLRQCEAPHSPQSVSLGSRLLKWKELMLFSEKAQKTTQTGGPTARSLPTAAPSTAGTNQHRDRAAQALPHSLFQPAESHTWEKTDWDIPTILLSGTFKSCFYLPGVVCIPQKEELGEGASEGCPS